MSASAERPGTQPLAALLGASVRFGATTALDRVDLDLAPGQVCALLGPNGAGKTTAVRLLLGLLAPTDGAARLFGADPRTPATRARIGAMLQVGKVPDTLRVAEHLDAFRAYYPAPLPRASLVAAAALEGLERRLFGTLSGGEKQRVLFALALAGNPELLFLDEPTVGMDVATRRAFWERIRTLRSDGRAVLLTTHYIEEADALADRVVVIDGGRIIADGTPDEIKGTVPARRIRCRTSLDPAHIRALPDVRSVAPDGAGIVIMTSAAEPVVRSLLEADPALSGLEVGAVALEDAFVALTRPRERSAA